MGHYRNTAYNVRVALEKWVVEGSTGEKQQHTRDFTEYSNLYSTADHLHGALPFVQKILKIKEQVHKAQH
jgi:PhoPQ-activated pathogenicity-related protein